MPHHFCAPNKCVRLPVLTGRYLRDDAGEHCSSYSFLLVGLSFESYRPPLAEKREVSWRRVSAEDVRKASKTLGHAWIRRRFAYENAIFLKADLVRP